MTARAHGCGRVLVVQRSANRDGSALSALMLADGLRDRLWDVHVALGWEGEVQEEFHRQGHEVHIVQHDSWLRSSRGLRAAVNVIREISSTRRFRRLIRRLRPDVVYVNTSVSASAALAARLTRVPVVWHLRENTSAAGGELILPVGWKAPVRWVFRFLASELVVNSRSAAVDLLGTTDGVEVVPNAAGPEFFDDRRDRTAARVALDLELDARLVGVPGTLRPSKGQEFLLRAVRPLLERWPDLTIVLAGEGAPGYVATLRDWVEREAPGRVRFLGSIRDMAAFYRACDVVCVPSVAEAFGRVVVEAFAAGTPVVATAVGGMRETVTNDKTGLLVPSGDERRLADAIERLLADPELGSRLSLRARGEAEEKYRHPAYQERLGRIVADAAALPLPRTASTAERVA